MCDSETRAFTTFPATPATMSSSAAEPPAPSSSDNPAAPERKRRRLGLQVSIEAGADGKPPIHQVFSDGTYIPATDSHFERTSAAATAFVYRALAAPAAGSASAETNATDSHEPPAQWAKKACTAIEGSIYELQQFLAAIEALRAETPLLELKRTVSKAARQGDGAVEVQEREGEGMLQAKKRLVSRSADFLVERVKALNKWIEADNDFCNAFLTLRKRCSGVRRHSNGTPLIDVGECDFAAVMRPRDVHACATEQEGNGAGGTQNEDNKSGPVVRILFPAATYLKFSVNGLDEKYTASTAPVVLENERSAEDQSLMAIVRRVLLSRVSAFRRKAFEQIAKEAATLPLLTEHTTNSVGMESGPRDIVRMEKTQRAGCAPSLDANTDPNVPPVDDIVELQTAGLLQIIATHACLTQAVSVGSQQPAKVLDRLIAATSSRSVLQATERVLDDAVKMLRVRLEWTRGQSRVEESRVRVFSTSADGDGPERALATVEPISKTNNGGNEGHNGHVRITPAFGVIIAAPDDPSARGRTVAPHSHSSSSGGTSSAQGLDDVPRSYVCPVGGEVLSVLTLLLCIRLLDALEMAARAGEEEMLDVDRQCFTVIVSAPTNGHTLKAKVWPRGCGVGEEVPGSTAWFNGHKIQDFPAVGPGRVAAWRLLLRRLVAGEVETDEEREEKEDDKGKATPGNGEAMQVEGPTQDHTPATINVVNTTGRGIPGLSTGGSAAEQGQFPFSQPQTDSTNQFRFDL